MEGAMKDLTRITFDPQVMGGKPCIRGVRVTVGAVVGLVAAGRSTRDPGGLPLPGSRGYTRSARLCGLAC